ncbi:tail fiber domain-containing protein [Patescibacteria group bacterium]
MFNHRNKNKSIKTLLLSIILLLVSGLFLLTQVALAQIDKTLDISAYILDKNNEAVSDGIYSVRFAIYTSKTGGNSKWSETQNVNIISGLFDTQLGKNKDIPEDIDFSEKEYYIGIKIENDSESKPRKPIGYVPLALNSDKLQGYVVGTEESNIPILNEDGEIDLDLLPIGSKEDKLITLNEDGEIDEEFIPTGSEDNDFVQVDDDRLHNRNEDTGTESLTFNVGRNKAISNNFDLTVSNSSAKPAIRYSGSTSSWQYTNDGVTYSNIGSATGSYLDTTGGTMTGNITFNSTQTFGGSSLTELGYLNTLTLTAGSLPYASSSTALTSLDGVAGDDGEFLKFTWNAGVPTLSWETAGTFDDFTLSGDSGTDQTVSNGNTLEIAGGTNISTVASATDTITINLDSIISGTTWNGTSIAANYGGTGLSSYTTGDLIYASGATTLAKIAGVATGNSLISGGVGVAPSWGKIGLSTHVSGILAAANGGTGINTSSSTGVPTISSGTWSVSSLLGVALGGTGTSTQFTTGSLVFAGASGVYSQDNSNLFWDNSSKELGIGTATPAAELDVNGTIKASNYLTGGGDPVNDILLPQDVRNYSINSLKGSVGLDMTDNMIEKVSPTVFESATTYEISTTALENGNILIAYEDDGNSSYGTFVIYDSDGSQIVAPTVFESAATEEISVTTLTNGNVLIAYQDVGNSWYGTFAIYDSAGNQVKAPTVFESADTYFTSATTLTNGNVLIAYMDGGNSNYGTFVIYDSAGNQVKAPTVFESADTYFTSATTLTNGNVLIAYRDTGNSNYGTFVIYDSDGSQVKAPTVFESASVDSISATTLSNGNTLVAYRDQGNSNYGTFVIYDSEGNQVVASTVFESADSPSISATTLANGNALIAYMDGGNSNYGTFVIYDSDGNQVKAPTVFASAGTFYSSAITLMNGSISIAYQNADNSNYGTFVIYEGEGAYFSGKVGIGTTSPSAFLNIKAGTATASAAPLKFTSGTNMTTPEEGAVEFDGTNLYFTDSTPTRQTIATTSSTQTFTNKTWNGSIIGVTYGGTGTSTQFTTGSLVFAGASGVYSQDNSNLFWDDTNDYLGIGNAAPAAKLDIDYNETATAAGSYYGIRSDTDSSGVFTTGTANVYGVYGDANAGYSTGGTVNSYGGYFVAAGENTGDATANAYGLYVNGATGADNNYSAVFMNGNVGIGTATPTTLLDISGTIKATSYLTSGGDPVNDILLPQDIRNYSINSLKGSVGLDMTDDMVEKVAATVFESAATSYVSTTTLANGNVLIAYRDEGNSNYGTFTIYDSAGSQIVAPTVFESASTSHVSTTTLTNGNVLIAYQDVGNSSYGTFVIYDSAGNQVIAPTVFESATTIYVSATTLTNGNTLIAYQNGGNSSYGTFVIYDSAGNQVIAPTVFESATANYTSATSLTNGDVLIAYQDGGNSSYGTFVIYDSVGNQVKAPTVFESAAVNYVYPTTLANGNIMIVYQDVGNSSYGTFVIYDSVGNQVTASTVFESAATSFISTTALTNGNVMITYTDLGNSSYGTFTIYDSVGTQVEAPTVFESASASNNSPTTLTNGNVLIAYEDIGNSDYGTFVIYEGEGAYFSGSLHSVGEISTDGDILITGTGNQLKWYDGNPSLDWLESTQEFRFLDGGVAPVVKVGALSVSSSYTNDPGTNGLYVEGEIEVDGVLRSGVFSATGATAGKTIALSSSNSILYSSVASTAGTSQVAFYNPNGLVGTIATNASATNFNTSSDYRLKENEVTIDSALGRVNSLKPYTFNFKTSPNKDVDGFYAHELQEIAPYAVTGQKDEVDESGVPVYQAVDYSKITPLLAAAIQEESKIVDGVSLKTDQNASTLTELQASIDEQLALVGLTINDIKLSDDQQNTNLLTVNDQLATQNLTITEIETKITENLNLIQTQLDNQLALETQLQEQIQEIEELKTQDEAILDFMLAINADNFITKDGEGNVTLQGNLKAEIVEGKGFVITIDDEEAPTIGRAIICSVIPVDEDGDDLDDCSGNAIPKDADEDGNDDLTNEAMPVDEDGDWIDDNTQEGIVNDGKSVFVETKAVGEDSKVFTTLKNLIDQPLVVTEVMLDEGFMVEIKNSENESIEFDWWIVESGV